MMQRDDTVYLKEILDSIELIQEYLHLVMYETFIAETMRQDAVIKQLKILANLRTSYRRVSGKRILRSLGCK